MMKTNKQIYTAKFFSRLGVTSDLSATTIVPWLVEMFAPKSIVDVGCGTGQWLNSFRAHGVDDIIGLDGSYIPLSQLQISETNFIAHDLTKRIEINRNFDVAICLEVAEHLPATRAESLVRDLCNLAPVVVFSAAVPEQGGTGHINEQWPEFWAALFKNENRLVLDCIRDQFWNHPDVAYHYSQNAFVYIDAELLDRNPAWRRYLVEEDSPVLSRIHPGKWIHARKHDNMENFLRLGLKRYLKALPFFVLNFCRRLLSDSSK